jgi:hypothetical protein
VAEVEPTGRRGKGGCLTIVFDSLELPNGEKVPILGSLTEVFFAGSDGKASVKLLVSPSEIKKATPSALNVGQSTGS